MWQNDVSLPQKEWVFLITFSKMFLATYPFSQLSPLSDCFSSFSGHSPLGFVRSRLPAYYCLFATWQPGSGEATPG
jgi:hypothetical protein